MRCAECRGSATDPARARRHRGFTLIEILVVMLIIGIMIAGAVLSVGVAHGDRDLEQERDRIMATSAFLRDQAALQNREYGIRCFRGGYEFLVLEPRSGLWQRRPEEDTMRPRKLAAGLELTLAVEGRVVILPEQQAKPDELAPQILLYSSGDLNLFELTIRRGSEGAGTRITPAPNSDALEAADIAAGRA
jgi:general secretion pathway protein H